MLVGGSFQNQDPALHAATQSLVASGAMIDASAVQDGDGDGGTIVVWSNDSSRVHGTLTARGGSRSGNGGLIETSGLRRLDVSGAVVDAAATNGQSGTWLIDPEDVVITTVSAMSLSFSGTASTATGGFRIRLSGRVNTLRLYTA